MADTTNPITYPYSDEYMTFDNVTNHYILTEKYVTEILAIDLDERINERTTINPQAMKNRLLRMASTHVYNFIHEHNINTIKQDYWIAVVPSLRLIIQQAMGEHLTYIIQDGDWTRSADLSKRSVWFDKSAQDILGQTVPELGTSILYTGRI